MPANGLFNIIIYVYIYIYIIIYIYASHPKLNLTIIVHRPQANCKKILTHIGFLETTCGFPTCILGFQLGPIVSVWF